MQLLKRHIIFAILFTLLIPAGNKNVRAQLPTSLKKKVQEYNTKAQKYESTGKVTTAANYYYKAGMLCFKYNAFNEAAPLFKKAGELNFRVENFKNAQIIYSNLALVYANTANYSKAMLYIENGLKIRKKYGTETDYAAGLLDLAYVYAAQKNYKKAILKVQDALETSTKTNNAMLTLQCFGRLQAYYKMLGNIKKSEEFSNKFVSLSDHYQKTKSEKQEKEFNIEKILEEYKRKERQLEHETTVKLIEQENKFTEDSLGLIVKMKRDSIKTAQMKARKDSAFIVLLEQEGELKSLTIQREEEQKDFQRKIITGVSIALILVAILGFVLIINRRKIQKHRKELAKAFHVIEEQNNDIKSSILYAREIQKAFLPKQENLKSIFKDSFIFFEPRDKVSGDFFWFTKSKYIDKTGNHFEKHFVSAIDCTGHGVPGALLSMTSFNILESIVNEHKIHEPNKILDELHEEVRRKLRQRETSNRDGMDMALISYDPNTKELQFSGAKNPILIIQNEKITRVRGSLKPIGGEFFDITEKQHFKLHKQTLKEPVTIYLFSDGFADQHSEKTGRKYMKKPFRDFLLSIHKEKFSKQQELITHEFEKWKGKKPQFSCP